MHYFAYIFKLGIFENQKNITLASQWPLKVVQIHMPHPVDTPKQESKYLSPPMHPREPQLAKSYSLLKWERVVFKVNLSTNQIWNPSNCTF